MSEFYGKVTLVTGAGSGIGRATALAFARAGARVLAADISDAAGAETAAMIRQTGGEAISTETDVASTAAVAAMVETAVATFGRLDFAFNNAGISGGRPGIDDFEEDIYDRVLAINAKGVWLGMKYEIPAMLRTGGGAFAYTASKHAVIGLTKAAAARYAGAGIHINAVCPGIVDTPMVARAAAAQVAAVATLGNKLGRAATPEEIAAAVLWLCSAPAAFVIGHPLVLDGGALAG
jgi:NAD(P)-dependent dehydrogenase (short-subunit alcohol dehydrogenase family)